MAKVLIVDDDPDAREICGIGFAGTMWETAYAFSGAEAIEVLDKERPDVVLLDVMMPGMDGFETLRRMRELPWGAKVAVIYVTACALPEEKAKYEANGALGIIEKPIDPFKLPDRIGRLLKGR